MKKVALLALGMLVFLLTACQAQPSPVPATATTVPPTESVVTPTEKAVATVPQTEPTQFVDYCLDCHADKEQLVALAKPEVETESESKGVG